MSVKGKVFASMATLTLVGGVGVAGLATAGAANAATPSCGFSCVDVFSHQFGDFADPSFVMDSYKQGDVAGTSVILFRTSNSDPAEDWQTDNVGAVSEFYALGLVSPEVDLHYGCEPGGTPGLCNGAGQADYEAYEFAYTPYGVDTGLCAGVAATAVNGEHVTLQPCGVSSKTIWIAGEHPVPSTRTVKFDPLSQFEEPLINGSDTNFTDPYSLTYNGSSYPTDMPRPVLYTQTLLGFTNHAENTNQLFSADYGVLP